MATRTRECQSATNATAKMIFSFLGFALNPLFGFSSLLQVVTQGRCTYGIALEILWTLSLLTVSGCII